MVLGRGERGRSEGECGVIHVEKGRGEEAALLKDCDIQGISYALK